MFKGLLDYGYFTDNTKVLLSSLFGHIGFRIIDKAKSVLKVVLVMMSLISMVRAER